MSRKMYLHHADPAFLILKLRLSFGMHLVCLSFSTRWWSLLLAIGQVLRYATVHSGANDDTVRFVTKSNMKWTMSLVCAWCMHWLHKLLGGMVAEWTPSLVPYAPGGAVSLVNALMGSCDTQSWYASHLCVEEAVQSMALFSCYVSLYLFFVFALPKTWRPSFGFCIKVLVTNLHILENLGLFVYALVM